LKLNNQPLNNLPSPPTIRLMNEDNFKDTLANPRNVGEMDDADAVGTVGSPDCGDMLRMWLKFKDVDGRRVIDRASFQSFGCQTAIAVASHATEMLKGRTLSEARSLSAEDMAAPLGALPPMKIHCGQLVEGALHNALENADGKPAPAPSPGNASGAQTAPTLTADLQSNAHAGKKIRIVPLEDTNTPTS